MSKLNIKNEYISEWQKDQIQKYSNGKSELLSINQIPNTHRFEQMEKQAIIQNIPSMGITGLWSSGRRLNKDVNNTIRNQKIIQTKALFNPSN